MSEFRLPRLQSADAIVDEGRRPASAFQRWWQSVVEAIEKAVADIIAVNESQSGLIDQLEAAVAAIEAAQAAADLANAAALAAQTAAADATTAASDANTAIAEIEAGNFDLAAVTVDGVRFINDGGVLTPEP